MAHFHFVTVWRIAAPLPLVCDAVSHCAAWPRWWRGSEQVEVRDPGDAKGLGSLRRFTWRGPLPYRITFDMRVTRIVPLSVLEGRASGVVEGTGRWSFVEDGGVTLVRYEWQVRTNCRWLNLMAAVARPVIKWNHDQVMRRGAEGMARLLNARLLGPVRISRRAANGCARDTSHRGQISVAKESEVHD